MIFVTLSRRFRFTVSSVCLSNMVEQFLFSGWFKVQYKKFMIFAIGLSVIKPDRYLRNLIVTLKYL